MTQPKLEPCPFCGGEGILESYTDADENSVWWVECYLCCAKREIEQSSALAILAWNTRTPLVRAKPSEAPTSGAGGE